MSDMKWDAPELARGQYILTSLDELLPVDSGIRLVEVVLESVDWSEWEERYKASSCGQPPIHPRLLAGCILYGLVLRIRSSRELEDATRNRIDFQWFLGRRVVDHSTFANFRTKFGDLLKALTVGFSRRLCDAVKDPLDMLVCDGTRIRANSDRHGARTGKTLERYVEEVARLLHERLEQLAAKDEQEDEDAQEAAKLRKEVESLKSELAKYEKAAAVAEERDAVRREKDGKHAKPVRVPVTDSDSMIVPNKGGGFAPNYTPTAVVDAASGAIISADVPEGTQENSIVLPAVEQARKLGGEPKRVMADSAFACGENLEQLEGEGVEACMPTGTDFRPTNPANRQDTTQPVPEEQWDNLPMNGTKLAPPAFIYDSQRDEYRCPMGKAMAPGRRRKSRQGVYYREYKCSGGADCPLAGRCLRKNCTVRTIRRDQYQHLREAAGRRMATEEGIELYKRRAPLIEIVFARIKGHMGVQRFLLRGLEKVRMEWNWVCCAYNLKLLLKMVRNGQIMLQKTAPTSRWRPFRRLTRLMKRFASSYLWPTTRARFEYAPG